MLHKLIRAASFAIAAAIVYALNANTEWRSYVAIIMAIIMLLAAASFVPWFLRLPMFVEAAADDEKIVIELRPGENREIKLQDIIKLRRFFIPKLDKHDDTPLLEFAVAHVGRPGGTVEKVRFRMISSAANLGTHPALAKLMRRLAEQKSRS